MKARLAMLTISRCLLLVFLLLPAGTASPAEAAPRKRVLLVLVDGMGAEWFFASRDPVLSQCGLGLMNAQSPTPVDVLSSYATTGAGSRVRFDAGAAAPLGGKELSGSRLGLRIAYLGPADSGAHPWTGRPARTLAEFDAAAVASCGPDAVPAALRLLETAEVVVYDRPDPICAPGFAFLGELLPHLDPQNDLVILTSPAPGARSNGQWDLLSGIAIWGGEWQGRGVTSATTRTPNLVANIDVAPTVLAHLGLPVPPSMEGHPIQPAGPAGLEEVLAFAQDRRAVRSLMTPVLLGWGALALMACIWAVVTLLSREPIARWKAASGQVLLAAPLCVAASMLLTAARPGTTESILIRLALWSGGLTLVCSGALIVRRFFAQPSASGTGQVLLSTATRAYATASPATISFCLLTAIILVDLYFGFGLLQRNLMSDFPNIGSRFYGIGNEWEGMLLGTTLLLPYLLPTGFGVQGSGFRVEKAERGRGMKSQGTVTTGASSALDPDTTHPHAPTSSPSHFPTLLLWGLTLVGVAAPWMGADFGGAVTLTLAYLISATVIAAPGGDRRKAVRNLVAAMVMAALAAAGLVMLDAMRPAGARTHVGELAVRALHGEWQPVLEMAGRKAALNLQTAASPFTVGGILAVSPVLWLCYHRLGPWIGALMERRSGFRTGLLSAVAGGLVGLLLNDTGVVTWAIATGCALVALLDALLNERLWEPQTENPR